MMSPRSNRLVKVRKPCNKKGILCILHIDPQSKDVLISKIISIAKPTHIRIYGAVEVRGSTENVSSGS